MPSMNYPAVPKDLTLEDKGSFLKLNGIHGKALYSPGHTSGSMSNLLDSGEAFVGDLAMGSLPQRLSPSIHSPFSVCAATSANLDCNCSMVLTSGGTKFL